MNWYDRKKRAARRRRLGRLLGGCGAGAGLVLITGLLLPREHSFSVSRLLPRSPELIWGVLIDLDGLPGWRSDLASVERLPDLDGRPVWREVPRRGRVAMTLELAFAKAPSRLVIRTTKGGHPDLPVRTIDLTQRASGTLVVLTERRANPSPLGRVWSRLRGAGGEVNRFFRDLSDRLDPGRKQVAAVPPA